MICCYCCCCFYVIIELFNLVTVVLISWLSHYNNNIICHISRELVQPKDVTEQASTTQHISCQ